MQHNDLLKRVSAKKCVRAVESGRFHLSGRSRKEFEAWIADDTARLGATIDKVLGEAGVTAREVEKVFLTGGTSFVPAVRRLFAERFGNERLMSGDQFESIAYGLP